ncbi:PAS domain S-box protein [Desulfogranum marinum]|uniref:PAS domain S-box protein n=1 Tax=Desulfogranum marinum TaxID=453220 RepID=UPI0029C79AB1|nr:PAS domain S-box protein [Desulfogranum marinum]
MAETEKLVSVGGWEWDIVKDKWIFSDNWLRIHGCSKRHLKTPELLPMAHPDDLYDIQKALDMVVAEGSDYEIEHRIIRQDTGEERYVRACGRAKLDSYGKTVKLYGSAQDITQQKIREKLLQESEKKYRYLINWAQEGIWVIDQEDNTQFANNNVAKMLGCTCDEMLGKNLFHFMDDEGTYLAKKKLARCRQGVSEQHDFEFIRKDGTRVFTTLVTAPILDNAGKYNGAIASLIDISERKQAEEALKEKTLLLEDISKHMFDMVSLSDLEGNFMFVSDSYERALGYTANEMTGKNIIDLVHPDDVSRIIDEFQTFLKRGGTKKVQYRYQHKSGNYLWLETIGEVLLDENQSPHQIIYSTRDITEHYEINQKLKSNEALFRGLYDNMTSGAAIYKVLNDGSKGSDYIVKNFNNKSLEIEGKTLQQVVGKSLFELRPGIDDYGLVAAMKKVWQTGEPSYFPVKIYQDEVFSSYYENYIFKIPTGEVVTIYNDVTDQKNAEIALKESEERFALAMEFANDGLFDWNLETNEIYYSPMWKRMLGYQDDELPNDFTVWETLTQPEDVKRSWELQNKLINGKLDKFEIEFKMKHKEGHWVDILARANATFDKNNKAIRIIGTHVDISERKKLENQLLQSQKLESIGNLAGGIAHEFNNILSIIIGNNELVMEDLPEWSLARESTEEIRIAGMRARDVVKQLLTFSRRDNAAKTVIDIGSVVKESTKLIRSSTPANIAIRQNLTEDVFSVFGNATQISQLLINLSNNAVDAMPSSGGILTIDLSNETVDGKRHVSLASGQYVKLMVCDNGIGMDKKTLDKIFDPFFTTKEVGKGTGIGLAVVHGIVERHCGSIFADSHLGQGTTFTIYLPIHERLSEDQSDKQTVLASGNERVLYVDDEPSIAKLGKRHLESLGYTAESTTDPLQALKIVKTNPGKFDLMISDMTMPAMTGEHLITEVLKVRPDMPTIICTGYSAKLSKKEAENIGVAAFVMKPLNKAEFAQTIRKVLDEAKGENQE